MTVDILLTGANGQVGWEIARRAKDVSVRALGRGDLDIGKRAHVLDAVAAAKPKVVINAAAYTAVDKAETEREAAFAINRDGPAFLAEACAAGGATLIHISTDYVFDGKKDGAYTEDDATAPLGTYGVSKLGGEEAVRAATPRHVILRTAWVHGIHGHNFVKTMLRLARERDTLRVVDDQHGCPTFAGDLADTILTIARHAMAGTVPAFGHGTFHCVGAGATTWCGFARRIVADAAARIGKLPKVEAIATSDYPTPAKRPANSVLDCGKLARVYGVTMPRWEDGLDEMLRGTLGA